MKLKKIFFGLSIFFIFFCTIFSATAQPPFTTQESSLETGSGIRIEYPKTVFKPTQDFKLNFHVHNSTNYLLDNTTTDCKLHIYNSQGDHLINQELLFDNTDKDFYLNINSSLLEQNEEYDYILYCNNSEEAGFVSSYFEVQQGNISYNEKILPGIIGIGLIIIILLLFSAQLDDSHEILKYFFKIVAVALVIAIPKLLIVQGSTYNIIFKIISYLFYIFFFYLLIDISRRVYQWYLDFIKRK